MRLPFGASARLPSTVLLAVAGLLGYAGPSIGQTAVDIQEVVRETQRFSMIHKDAGNEMTLVWWMPIEYWEESLRQNPAITKDTIAKFRATLDPYTMVAVARGQMGPFGGMTYQTPEAVRASVTLKDSQGVSYTPLADEKVSADARNLLGMLKPIVANMLGAMGQNINFLFFNVKSKDGRRIADAHGDRPFSVTLGDSEYKFRTPLGSLMPPKFDAETHEQFPGNYLYSPFTGGKLTTVPPAAASPATSGAAPPQPQ